MGIRKDLHIRAILDMTSVRERWRQAHGRDPEDKDVDVLYKDFVPVQLEVLRNPMYTRLLPGCAESIQTLKTQYNLKVINVAALCLLMA